MTTKKRTKRALLSSVLATALCVAMLIGTTFAWFTHSVTSGKNRIVAGNLDVELEYSKDGGNTWNDVTEETNLFQSADETLWEPGHTEYVQLRVSNVGSLALKYNFALNIFGDDAGLSGEKTYTNKDGGQFKLSDYLVFYKIDSTEKPATREALWITDAAAEQAAMGAKALDTFAAADAKLLPGNEEAFTLAVYMPTWVGNEANCAGDEAPVIYLGLTLNATQAQQEKDSFNNRYDSDAYYADVYVNDYAALAASLQSAEKGDIIAIESSIQLTEALTVPPGVTVIGKNDAAIAVPVVDQPITLSQGAKLANLQFTVPAFDSGTVNVVYMMDNSAVTGCTFTGAFAGGNEVSRGVVVAPGAKNVVITDNTFDALRQPAYINNEAAGTVTNNTVTGTKGFVVCCDSMVNFADNTFFGNVVDIAIIASNTDVDNYADIAAISAANGYAYVENKAKGDDHITATEKPVEAADEAALTAALTQAQPGDVIALDPAATYEGSFEMADGAIINGNGATVSNDGTANTFNVRSGVDATIKNVNIQSQSKKYGIHVQPGAGDVIIEGCTITGTTATMGHAVWINGNNAGNAVIKNCTISRPINFSGYNSTVANVTIEDNTFTNTFGVRGLTLSGSMQNILIRNNTFGVGGMARIHKDGVNNFHFVDVVFEGNTGSTSIYPDNEVKDLYQSALDNGNVVLK